MTVESLKTEVVKLSKIEKLEFLQFLADLLSSEAKSDVALSEQQQQTLARRRSAVKNGTVKTIPYHEAEAQLRAAF